MTDQELDRLLDGAQGVTLTTSTGKRLTFTRHELQNVVAWRSAMRRQLGHTGYRPPVYDQGEHDQIVRVIFRLVEAQGAA